MRAYPSHIGLYALLAAALLSFTTARANDSEAAAAVSVVQQFNAAISQRNMEAVMLTLAEGSVQLQLRPVHPGMSSNPPLTGDLRKTWQMVAAILFPTSDAYTRTADVISARADGDLATVWAQTMTRTARKGESEPMVLNFSELYVLVKKAGLWKIAVVADNRAPDGIRVAPQAE